MADASEKWAKGSRPAKLGRVLAVLGFVLSTLAAISAGCGTSTEKPPATGGGGPGSGGSTSSIPGGCIEGTRQECHVTLAQHGSVVTCYTGKQICTNGDWGPCVEGGAFQRLLPGGGSIDRIDPDPAPGDRIAEPATPIVKPLSLTDAGPCIDAGFNDPCDPSCMGYPEVPDGGISIIGTGNPGWKTGSIAVLPGSVLSKGLKVPCSTASDCQFNEFCGNPATAPACAHDKCATGSPLLTSCGDTCVQQICAKPANALCCSSATCGHDLCTTGPQLASGCDPCVTSICATRPSCCSTAWDATCTAMVPTTCGLSCSSWSAACVKEVHDTCGDICDPPKATCSHNVCYTGDPLVNHCDDGAPGGDCVKDICAARPSCCSTAWDATCKSMVASTCMKSCSTPGVCDPWIAGQVDPSCPSADLTLGVPCSAQIPVCNVGTATAMPPPGGIIVHHWPGGTSNMPTCSPDTTAGADCPPLMQPIPPGQCVMLNCAVTDKDELMVNSDGAVSECTCQNNWSINSTATGCEPAVCTGPQSTFTTTNLLMHIAVDRSMVTSTVLAPGQTIWAQIQTGLNSFYSNSANATARSSLTFFPDSPPPSTAPTCDIMTCTAPFTCQPRQSLAFANNLNFPNAISMLAPASTGPPTSAAYDGVIRMATPFTTSASFASDTHIVVMILASDVANCNPSVPAMAAAAAAALANYKIRTYVIGIGVPATTTSAIASAGGGQAFNLVANTSLWNNLATTLNGIRAGYVPCSFTLPPAGEFDPTNPYLGYVSGMPATTVAQTQVADLASCGATGGFYYDNNVSPTQVLLCPNLCTTHRNTLNSAIKLIISCPTNYAPWSAPPQTYQGTCPPGTQVQWALFGYDSTAGSDSQLSFTAQVAPTLAGLATAPVIPLATSHSIPTDTQVCPVPTTPPQVPTPTCAPIDLFTALGGIPAARYDFLQLNMDFTPSSSGTVSPTVTDWQVTYSCVADQ